MRPASYKYAQLPKFQYQPVQRHYQTFDYNTASYYTYPIAPSDDLTAPKVQDDNGPSAEPEETSPAEAAAEEPAAEPAAEPSSSPDESAASPENGGKCLTLEYYQLVHFKGGRL